MSAGERADRLAAIVAEEDLDLLIVGDLVRPGDSHPEENANLRWLTGFAGTSGIALLGPRARIFITDFRYVERAEREVDASFERRTVAQRLVPELAGSLFGRVGYDDARTSVRVLRMLEEEAPEGVELVPAGALVDRLRRSKDAAEQRAIEDAARLADEVYGWTLARGLAGRSEREVARAAEARIRELGGEPAFPVIVAAGENGALPHAEPSKRTIGAGELVVFDMGAAVDGYCSDCTRTFATGPLDGEAEEVYRLVLKAQVAALDAVRPGVSGSDVDSAARSVIADAGYGEGFGHGLGHGVGLEVHEPPRLSQRSDDTLVEGDVVTIEPGIYLPARFGVRIEDLVVVTEQGHRNLSSLSKDPAAVS
jgi:Xaa-Pro aminopeptidase